MTEMQNLDAEAQRRFCDQTVERAAALMEERGADVGMILDRLITFAAAQAVLCDGSTATAETFRHLAERLDSGVFQHLDNRRCGRFN